MTMGRTGTSSYADLQLNGQIINYVKRSFGKTLEISTGIQRNLLGWNHVDTGLQELNIQCCGTFVDVTTHLLCKLSCQILVCF